jgi:hypothetical protein
VYAGWFDKRVVHVLSNCYQPIGNDNVEHWYNAKKGEKPTTAFGKVQKELSPIVKAYQTWMGAVDRFDQFCAYIHLEMRTTNFCTLLFGSLLSQHQSTLG